MLEGFVSIEVETCFALVFCVILFAVLLHFHDRYHKEEFDIKTLLTHHIFFADMIQTLAYAEI